MSRDAIPGLRRDSGAVLVVTLAILGILSILVVAFSRFARLESEVGQVGVDAVRARMVAQAGIEFAAARLREDAGRGTTSDPEAAWTYGGGDLETAPWPSYRAGSVHGWTYSGTLGGTWIAGGDQFVLRILDAGSQLDLAARTPDLPAMLDVLGRAIAEDLARRGLAAVDPIRGRGAEIVAWRDAAGGFRTKSDLRAVLGAADFERVEPSVTVHAWRDPRTIAPAAGPPVEDFPAFRAEPRAPIGVNTAPWPVLVAVLEGVAGPSGVAVSYAAAARIATRIVERRTSPLPSEGPFSSWPEFHEFLAGLAADPGSTLSAEQALALSVNADPNFHPAGLALERVVDRPFDKLQLRRRSTEFTFHETGLYEVTSLARVLGPSAEVRASARCVAVLEVFGLLQHTVEEDFERHRLSSPATHATTWPGPASGRPADWAGHVQLQTDRPRHRWPRWPWFELALRDGLVAESASGPVEAWTEQEAGPDAAREGGDLLSDGLLFTEARRELTGYPASAVAPLEEGTIEFWMKLVRRPSTDPLPLIELTIPTGETTGIQHRISAATDGSTLRVRSERLAYVAATAGPEPERAAVGFPWTFERTLVELDLAGAGVEHEWHHVSVAWRDGTDQVLRVDGVPGRTVEATPTSPAIAFEGWPPHEDRLVLGGSLARDRGRELGEALLDDLVGYDDFRGLPPGPPPARFQAIAPLVVGVFRSAFAGLPAGSELLGIRFTVWTPRSWSGTPLVGLPVSVELAIDLGAGPIAVPDGAFEETLEILGLGVVLENERVVYELRFHRAPSPAARNVTPIVDDVTLLYATGRPRVVEFHWDPGR